jgi:hypothetical protein
VAQQYRSQPVTGDATPSRRTPSSARHAFHGSHQRSRQLARRRFHAGQRRFASQPYRRQTKHAST